MADTHRPRTPGGLYFVGIGLIGSAIAIAVTGFMQMADSVRGLQRAMMPGRAEVTLAAGKSFIYAERRSIIDNAPFEGDYGELRCAMTNARGEPVTLVATTGKTRYTFGGYAGQSTFEVDLVAPGTYAITCDGAPIAIAVGGGVGAWIVVALVGGLLPGLGGLAICIVVFLKRRAQLRAPRQP